MLNVDCKDTKYYSIFQIIEMRILEVYKDSLNKTGYWLNKFCHRNGILYFCSSINKYTNEKIRFIHHGFGRRTHRAGRRLYLPDF